MFTSWRSTLTGLSSGIVGILFLTDVISGGAATIALSITSTVLGLVVPDEKKVMDDLNGKK